jgi:hypothetical protein
MWTDGWMDWREAQRDITKLIVAFRNFANVPKNVSKFAVHVRTCCHLFKPDKQGLPFADVHRTLKCSKTQKISIEFHQKSGSKCRKHRQVIYLRS